LLKDKFPTFCGQIPNILKTKTQHLKDKFPTFSLFKKKLRTKTQHLRVESMKNSPANRNKQG
jgi:hypothetical protein